MDNIRVLDVKAGNDGETTINHKAIPEDIKRSTNSLFPAKVKGAIVGDQSIKFKDGSGNLRIVYGSNGTPNIEHILPDIVAESFPKEYNTKRTNNSGGGGNGMSDLERRVQNLEGDTQKLLQQVEEIKGQNSVISYRLENAATKTDLLQMKTEITNSILSAIKPLPSVVDIKNTIREVNKEDSITTTNDVKLIVSENLKDIPTTNDIKAVLDTTISDKKLANETVVENILMKSRTKIIVWMIATGIAFAGATAGIMKLFL
ncbi:hypothetical protein [Priestia aryabhattai]|uniref:hypothetical protein n=1 Tax=Priestia aryabhattai TaxID=412384 RepID=UPI0032E8FE1A